MLLKFFKIFFFISFLIFQSSVYPKNNNNEFNSKNLSNYFSAIVSYDNQKNVDSLKFFKSSKSLINRHDPFLKKYIFSLIIEGEMNRAIHELKHFSDKKSSDFFEAYLILVLDNIKKKDFKKSSKYLDKLSKFKDNSTMELIIYESLKNYSYLFKNKKILSNINAFGNLSLISGAFQNCYLGKKQTQSYFEDLIHGDTDYTRYKFFYINYLIEQNKFDKINEIVEQIDTLNSSLLISLTKTWVDKKNFEKFSEVFSCNKETDILSEYFFLIANLYSSEYEFEKSNFYLNISYFLNPKFKYNLSLLSENYFINNNYRQCEKVLNYFDKNDDIFYWYKIKRKARIISGELGEEQSFNYVNSKFKRIRKPSIKILFDMANIAKSFKKYQISIDYYDEVLSKISRDSQSYSDVLYRRGASYERLGKFEESDQDLLNSLEINPDDAYILNYLAYAWLERNYKIDIAIQMLEKAYDKKKNDPYIIDSVGWAYYLVDDLVKAEQFMNKAIQLMPNDPIVNDHYGDILWKLDRKIQAIYYWNSVLNFEDTEEDMKQDTKIKLLKGPKKI